MAFTTKDLQPLNTCKDLAAALRKAQEMIEAGEIARIDNRWVDVTTSPMGACAAGGIALVSGMSPDGVWSWTLRNACPVLGQKVPNEGGLDVLDVISNKNERGVSWLEIAEWLEGLE